MEKSSYVIASQYPLKKIKSKARKNELCKKCDSPVHAFISDDRDVIDYCEKHFNSEIESIKGEKHITFINFSKAVQKKQECIIH